MKKSRELLIAVGITLGMGLLVGAMVAVADRGPTEVEKAMTDLNEAEHMLALSGEYGQPRRLDALMVDTLKNYRDGSLIFARMRRAVSLVHRLCRSRDRKGKPVIAVCVKWPRGSTWWYLKADAKQAGALLGAAGAVP